MSQRQVAIRVAGIAEACRHPRRAQQPIVSSGGRRIAERCGLCHRTVQWKKCAGCARHFRATEATLRHGRLYHSVRCRSKAAYRRRRDRADGRESML